MTTRLATHPDIDLLADERACFRAYLVARVGNEAEAFDFIQNSLIKAIRVVTEINEEPRLSDWFLKVLRRAVVEHVRSRPSPAAREQAWRAATAASSADDARAINRCFKPLIATLRPRHAALLHLIELDGASVWAAAAALGITANGAWRTLYRSRAELRDKLEAFCHACVQDSWASYPVARSA